MVRCVSSSHPLSPLPPQTLTTCHYSGTDDEASEDATLVGRSQRSFGDGPEQDGAERVEGQTHDDSLLVAESPEDFCGNRGEQEVTDTDCRTWRQYEID